MSEPTTDDIYDVSIEEAAEVIARARGAQCGPCELCEIEAFDSTREVSQLMERLVRDGWEMDPSRPAYFKRCEACQGTPRFPWAARLDAERVREYIRGVYERAGGPTVFSIADLEHLA